MLGKGQAVQRSNTLKQAPSARPLFLPIAPFKIPDLKIVNKYLSNVSDGILSVAALRKQRGRAREPVWCVASLDRLPPSQQQFSLKIV